MLNYIPDGYTERGHIEAADGLHEALSFAYRPMLVEERDAIDEAIATRPAREAAQVVAAAVTHALVEWDLRDEHGCPVAVGLEYVRRLRPALLDKVYAVVSGRVPNDPPPKQTESQERDYVANLLETASTGRDASEIRQEADRKN